MTALFLLLKIGAGKALGFIGGFLRWLFAEWYRPVMLALETDTTGKLIHAKVQDPSLANWFGLAMALRNNEISDFPICNKSFDLSYCGNDL